MDKLLCAAEGYNLSDALLKAGNFTKDNERRAIDE